MSRLDELKRLASMAHQSNEKWFTCKGMMEGSLRSADSADFRFIEAANPEAILALIAENEHLTKQLHMMVRQCLPLEAMEGMPGWSEVVEAHKAIEQRDQARAEVDALRKDAERWKCVRNAIPMQSPYAVWREGSHLVLGKDADELVDNFLKAKDGSA